jgi:hypothetical protein
VCPGFLAGGQTKPQFPRNFDAEIPSKVFGKGDYFSITLTDAVKTFRLMT